MISFVVHKSNGCLLEAFLLAMTSSVVNGYLLELVFILRIYIIPFGICDILVTNCKYARK